MGANLAQRDPWRAGRPFVQGRVRRGAPGPLRHPYAHPVDPRRSGPAGRSGCRRLTTTRSFYDSHGSFAGQSFTRGNSTSFSDGQGRFSGSAIRNSNGTTSFYDGRGRFTGSSIDTGPRR